MKKFLFLTLLIIVGLGIASYRKIPEKINYGVSFSVFHSNELELDWRQVYNSLVEDLGVKNVRLSAHWPLTEPSNNDFNFSELDYQLSQAEKHDISVIMSVGRRLPGWPECHEPDWAQNLSKEEKQKEVLEYIERVVSLYKNSRVIKYWQVENEPFLTSFAKYHCGDFLDKNFLKKEIALVKSIDPETPVLVTDSGEIGLWYNAYSVGDVFGTSMYLYIWNHYIGPMRYPITPSFFKLKRNLIELIYGKKEALLIELSLEPWLLQPIKDTSIETALDRMDIQKFNKIIKFARKSGFETQYLWGAEWWYFMKEKKHPEFWARAKEIFSEN